MVPIYKKGDISVFAQRMDWKETYTIITLFILTLFEPFYIFQVFWDFTINKVFHPIPKQLTIECLPLVVTWNSLF